MHEQDNSGETATETAIKYGLLAAGIAVAIIAAVQLTGTVGKRDSIMVCSVVACWSVNSP